MKAQVGAAAVMHAVFLFIISGFLIYFIVSPTLEDYRLQQIAREQLNPGDFSPLMLLVLYILVPFIWFMWAFMGIFYVIKTAQSNRGVL